MLRQQNGTWILSDDEMSLFALYACVAKETYEEDGCMCLFKQAKYYQDKIFQILESAGYYERRKN